VRAWFAARATTTARGGREPWTDLDRKIEATYAFADSVIKPLIGPESYLRNA